MKIIEVKTQVEFDAAIRLGAKVVCLSGRFKLITSGTESPRIETRSGTELHVEAWGSSTPHVVAWGSSTPHVEAWGSSTPHVVAWESSTPHVVAWESSTPHVVASGYCQVSLFGHVIAKVAANVRVLVRGKRAKVEGGQVVHVDLSTPEKWCEYYGVEIKDRAAILFKAVDDDYSTSRARPVGIFYRPGEQPIAPDWDGGERECGGGLHFSPAATMGLEFNSTATRFVACPVAIADISVHPDGQYPHKVKARAVCAPIWEVDRKGART